MVSLLVTLLLALQPMAGEGEPSLPARLSKIRSLLTDRMSEESVPSLAVGVTRGEEVLWLEAFGWADRDRGTPATVHTPYSLASVTKPLTATLLMIWVQQGAIALERPIADYLGEGVLRGSPDRVAAATVERVASHTAGLPLHHHFFPADGPSPPPMSETLKRHAILVGKPGSEYGYSNLGYGVLELVLERVSGSSFAELLARDLARPLKLEHTAVLLDPELAPDRARRYDREGGLPFYDFDHRGASAAWACVDDLLRFGQFHLGILPSGAERVLERARLRRMQQPSAALPEGGAYGLGWRIRDRRGDRTVGHTGGMPGVSTVLLLVPKSRLVIAVLANRRSELVSQLGEEILAALSPRRSARPPATLAPPLPSPFAPALRRRRRLARPLRGLWRGAAEAEGGMLALTLDSSSRPTLSVGDGSPLLMRDLRANRRRFRGVVAAELRPKAGPQRLELHLELEGERLRGRLGILSPPGARFPSALSGWVELERIPAAMP